MRIRVSLPSGLALAGGVAAVIGSFLAWAELSFGPISERATGIEGWEGKAAIVGGFIMVVPGIAGFVGTTEAGARLRAALIGGLIAAGVGIYTAVTADDQVLGAAVEADVPIEIVREAIADGLLRVSLEAGLYIVIAGGALGVLAGVLAFGARAPAPPMPVGGTEGGLRGWAAPVRRATSDAGPSVPPPPEQPPWAPGR